jgi:hypothetical protein
MRRVFANAALVIASLLVGYFVLELAFFRVLLPTARLAVRPHLPELADVLMQTSKSQYIPRDYIAVLGDSYAEGIGDWLLDLGGNEARPFHSTHIIHELTGRDVVSFGKGGAGSAEALVLRPTSIIASGGCISFPSIDVPSRIVAYFYEGNDLEDNLGFARKVQAAQGRTDAPAIDAYLRDDYGTFAAWRCRLYLADTIGRMIKFAYQWRWAHYDNIFRPRPLGPVGPGTNQLEIAGQVMGAPVPLSGPALELSDDEIALGTLVLDRSLAWLRNRFPAVPVTMVYVPSPLSVYRVGSPVIYLLDHNTSGTAPAAAVGRNSNRICKLVLEAALRHGADMLNARPQLRALAEKSAIHGPRDWGHFNETGYRALGQMVARHLADGSAAADCE